MEATLRAGLTALGLPCSAVPQLLDFAGRLLEKNRVMNLTAIHGERDVAQLHFLDCSALLTAEPFAGKSVIDVGTGAGFPGLPLKILSQFEPEHEAVLEPGDMLYLPPQAAHDGVAIGDGCVTVSIGFRAPTQAMLARGLLEAAADQAMARIGLLGGPYGEPALPGPRLDGLYRDPGQPATAQPAALPDALVQATLATLDKLRFDDALAARFLGCWLTEPNQMAVFDSPLEHVELEHDWPDRGRLMLDRRSRMLYRDKQLFINGETAMVRAEPALRLLADARSLDCTDPACRKLSDEARSCLADWLDSGWLHYRA